MTDHPFRLVVNRADPSEPATINVPAPGPAGLHIHLHIGATAPNVAAVPPVTTKKPLAAGRSGKRRWRSWLMGAAGVVIAVVAFDFGARSGEGHARELAAQADASNLTARLSGQPLSAAPAPGELPPAVRQQLAQPPTITPPPSTSQQSAGSPSPFGLHP
jgi:hypothetical protein